MCALTLDGRSPPFLSFKSSKSEEWEIKHLWTKGQPDAEEKCPCNVGLMPPVGHIHQAARGAARWGGWIQRLIPPATP